MLLLWGGGEIERVVNVKVAAKTNMHHFSNFLEIVILSGGIRETGSKFLNQIKKSAKKYVLIPHFPEIKWTNLEHPGVLGASLLIK